MLLELTVAEQRFNAVMEVLRDGLTVIEVAERYGVSRQSRPQLAAPLSDGGLDALADRSHRPPLPPQMPADGRGPPVRAAPPPSPGWGQRRLAHELVRDGVDPPPGLTSIYRALVRNGLIQPRPGGARKADYRRWERDRPMELWQLDVMGGIWLADGRELKAVTGMDDHSRFCVMAGLVERANARSVCRVFTAALARYGSPEEVLTDNGKVFTGRLGPHPGEVLFDRICREHGITHRLTGVRCPTTTGKIERFHKTLRAELLTGRRFDSLAPRPTGARRLGGRLQHPPPPPGDRHGRPGPTVPTRHRQPQPDTRTPSQPARPATLSPTEVTPRVSASGLIGVCYQQVAAGRHLAGQIVTVRLHPPSSKSSPPPAHPHRPTHQHQGGGPTPSPPTPPAQTTTHNHLGSVGHHPEPTRKTSTRTGHGSKRRQRHRSGRPPVQLAPRVRSGLQRLKHPVPHALAAPTVEPAGHRRPRAELAGQVPPGHAGSVQPHDCFHEQLAVFGRPAHPGRCGGSSGASLTHCASVSSRLALCAPWPRTLPSHPVNIAKHA